MKKSAVKEKNTNVKLPTITTKDDQPKKKLIRPQSAKIKLGNTKTVTKVDVIKSHLRG